MAKKLDKSKLFGRVMAGILVGLMLFGSVATLLFYIFSK